MVLNEEKTQTALIIDDEEEIGILLGYQLKKLGIKNSYAPDLNKGKKLYQNEDFNMVFLDINLPDGNGLDIIPELKEKNKDVRIVVISAYNVEEDQKRAFKLGADHFMGKPFNSQQIQEVVK